MKADLTLFGRLLLVISLYWNQDKLNNKALAISKAILCTKNAWLLK
jgi:hypothetical protein